MLGSHTDKYTHAQPPLFSAELTQLWPASQYLPVLDWGLLKPPGSPTGRPALWPPSPLQASWLLLPVEPPPACTLIREPRPQSRHSVPDLPHQLVCPTH